MEQVQVTGLLAVLRVATGKSCPGQYFLYTCNLAPFLVCLQDTEPALTLTMEATLMTATGWRGDGAGKVYISPTKVIEYQLTGVGVYDFLHSRKHGQDLQYDTD